MTIPSPGTSWASSAATRGRILLGLALQERREVHGDLALDERDDALDFLASCLQSVAQELSRGLEDLVARRRDPLLDGPLVDPVGDADRTCAHAVEEVETKDGCLARRQGL